jgi:hypothetical protein
VGWSPDLTPPKASLASALPTPHLSTPDMLPEPHTQTDMGCHKCPPTGIHLALSMLLPECSCQARRQPESQCHLSHLLGLMSRLGAIS